MKNNVLRSLSKTLAALSICTAFVACEKDPGPIELNGFPDGTEFDIRQGCTMEVPFTVGNIKSDTYEITAVSDNEDFTASIHIAQDDPTQCVLVVTSPEYIYHESTFKVTINITDSSTERLYTCDYIFNVKLSDDFQAMTEAANCFLVKPGALVSFPAYSGPGSEKVSFSTAELLWQDANGMVKMVDSEPENSLVYVDLNDEISGNAVIALKNSTGEIVWSYNLWVSDYDPSEHAMTYTKDADTYVFMDRYLGALSSEPGLAETNGNFYQWGRKDAFVGPGIEGSLKPMYDIEGNAVEAKREKCSAEDNIPNGIMNPLTHYEGVSASNYGWLTISKEKFNNEMLDLWGAVSGNKSQYDPCPAGWMVPPVEAWGFYSSFKAEKVYSNPDEPVNKNMIGRYWKASEESEDKYFFPAMGEVAHASSYGNGIGSNWPCNKAWTGTADPANFRVYATSVSPSSASPKGGISSGYELPVRCIKVK